MGLGCEVFNFETYESLRRSMSVNITLVFKDSNVAKKMPTIQDKYVVVPKKQSPKQHFFCLQNILHSMFIIRGRRRK